MDILINNNQKDLFCLIFRFLKLRDIENLLLVNKTILFYTLYYLTNNNYYLYYKKKDKKVYRYRNNFLDKFNLTCRNIKITDDTQLISLDVEKIKKLTIVNWYNGYQGINVIKNINLDYLNIIDNHNGIDLSKANIKSLNIIDNNTVFPNCETLQVVIDINSNLEFNTFNESNLTYLYINLYVNAEIVLPYVNLKVLKIDVAFKSEYTLNINDCINIENLSLINCKHDLDLSKHNKIKKIKIWGNDINILNLNSSIEKINLHCSYVGDFSKFIKLKYLCITRYRCDENKAIDLDLRNTLLEYLKVKFVRDIYLPNTLRYLNAESCINLFNIEKNINLEILELQNLPDNFDFSKFTLKRVKFSNFNTFSNLQNVLEIDINMDWEDDIDLSNGKIKSITINNMVGKVNLKNCDNLEKIKIRYGNPQLLLNNTKPIYLEYINDSFELKEVNLPKGNFSKIKINNLILNFPE